MQLIVSKIEGSQSSYHKSFVFFTVFCFMLQEQQGLLVHLFPNRFALVQVQKDNWLSIYTPFSGTRPTFFGDKDTFFWDTRYTHLKKQARKKRQLAICYHFSTDFVLSMSLLVLANLYKFSILN